ncbi:MAG TPA: SusD/RagB family nutrient-binding outer membrane lipoprotein [Puia sp.]|nr:SusD/RagB family nutrient-binding outer membrane lipoprotein [Puia sp.]
MKNRNYKIICLFFLAGMILLAASCKKSFFTDVNINPQAPASVGPNVQLSTVEIALGYTMGGDLTRFSGMLDQQIFGANSQSQTWYGYGLNPGAFDNLWPDLYTSTMENDYDLMKNADAAGYNVYSGVSRILMAYTLQIMVDSWGNIPYSEALRGADNLHPVYDDAKSLYDTISNLVDMGIAQLNDAKPGSIVPGTEDQIYGGNTEQWIKFGHAIKARLYMHQSKGNASMASSAISEIGQSFASNADNAEYLFGNTQTSANPRYQFNRDRPGDETYSNATIAQQMKALNDPRYPIYFDEANDGLGLDPTGMHFGGLNNYYGAVNSPVEFITYEELLFMKAEATITISGDIAAAQVFYDSAIQASMVKLGVAPAAIATYLAANGTLPPNQAAAIAQIGAQEYIALYLNPESWVVWRRTGSPTLLPVTGNDVPRRLLYPQSEYSYNGDHVPANVTLFSPVIFWDH